MGEYGKPGFLHLNVANEWPGLHRRGLQLAADGSLSLLRVPRLAAGTPAELSDAPSAEPAGIAVTWDGSIFYTDRDQGRLRRIGGCAGETSCFTGVDSPRLLASLGTQLAIEEPGSGRILIYDTESSAVVEIRDVGSLAAMTSDHDGNLYLSPQGKNLIRKYDRRGGLLWHGPAPLIDAPVALAASGGRIAALGRNAQGKWIAVTWRPGETGSESARGGDLLKEPKCLALSDEAIYVGDAALRGVLQFSLADDTLFGSAVGYHGPVAAIGLDAKGGLLVYPGGSFAPLRTLVNGGSTASGVAWGFVKTARNLPVTWHRAIAFVAPLAPEAHFQFYYAADKPGDPTDSAKPFDGSWTPAGLDNAHFFIDAGKSSGFWIGLHMFSDGSATPAISQIRVEYDQPAYQSFLPPLFRKDGQCGNFLLRYLTLFESFFGEAEGEIDSLRCWFDPNAAPASVLPWLETWLAIDSDEAWSDVKRREVIRRAFDLYGRRGTLRGLREAIELFTGVRVTIIEPIRGSGWWGFPGERDCTGDAPPNSAALGWATAVMGVEPQGAVVGVSAVLDRSHLIRNDDFGAPLFEDVAYRFVVLVHASDMHCEGTLQNIRKIIEREKPAHTAYELCVVQPGVRIGQQSRVGVDTVLGGKLPPVPLDGESVPRLTGSPSGALGQGLQIGINTRC